MILYVDLIEILHVHSRIIEQSGGSDGLRDLALLESALAQPRMTFGGQDLYPTIPEKAASLGFSLVANHPFVDGNKRIGHAAVEAFLMRNGWELIGNVGEQEAIILQLASGTLSRDEFTAWVRAHVQPLTS